MHRICIIYLRLLQFPTLGRSAECSILRDLRAPFLCAHCVRLERPCSLLLDPAIRCDPQPSAGMCATDSATRNAAALKPAPVQRVARAVSFRCKHSASPVRPRWGLARCLPQARGRHRLTPRHARHASRRRAPPAAAEPNPAESTRERHATQRRPRARRAGPRGRAAARLARRAPLFSTFSAVASRRPLTARPSATGGRKADAGAPKRGE